MPAFVLICSESRSKCDSKYIFEYVYPLVLFPYSKWKKNANFSTSKQKKVNWKKKIHATHQQRLTGWNQGNLSNFFFKKQNNYLRKCKSHISNFFKTFNFSLPQEENASSKVAFWHNKLHHLKTSEVYTCGFRTIVFIHKKIYANVIN